MSTTVRGGHHAAARADAMFVLTALIVVAACADQTAPTGVVNSPPPVPSTPSPPPTPPPAPSPLHVDGVFTSAAWWAGSTYPVSPLVAVTSGATAPPPTPVLWTATNGGVLAPDVAGATTARGLSKCPAWTLGGAGIDSVTATVGPALGSTDTLHISFSVVAVSAPAQFSEYQLMLVDGQPPPATNEVEFDLIGGLLRLGDNGTLEWIENQGGFLGTVMFWGAGRYTAANGSIAFSPIPGVAGSKFPGDSATTVGDTITSTFPMVISLGLDTETVSRTGTYVRTSGPPINALRARGPSLLDSTKPIPRGMDSRGSRRGGRS